MARDVLEVHTEVGKQDFLDIRPSMANKDLSEIDVFGPDGKVLYELRPAEPLDRTSLLVVLAQRMAADPLFAFGRDQLPYRWQSNRWVSVERWMTSLDYSMHALVRTSVNRRMSSDSLTFEALAAWQANSIYPLGGLDLRAFGKCDGIPFQDFVLKMAKGGKWDYINHKPENFNTHILDLSAGEAGRMYLEVSLGDHEDSLLMTFLRTSLDDDQQIVFRRWLGYHLLASKLKNAEKMLYLWGAGGNGKSQLLWLIRGLVGDEACAELRLPDLRTSANIEMLVSKLAMVGSEAKTKTDLETLKSLISREPLNCNPKYRDPFTVTPECLVTQASNQPPEFGEQSDAMVRRTLSLHLKNSFINKPTLKEDIAKTIVDTEKELLVGLALWGAVELSTEGKFYVPDAVIEASKKTVSGGNQIAEFLSIVEFGPYEISQGELFDVYIRWCRDQGHSPAMTSVKLTDEVVRLSEGLKRTVFKSAKASSYEPQFWIDDRGDKCQVRKAMKKNARPPTVRGLRIGEQIFGLPIGQDISESSRIGHLFEVAPLPVTVPVDESVTVK
jgi:hypothetical protein